MIPCKRPKVRVNEMLGRDQLAVVCDVDGCGFATRGHVVKTAAQEEARWHREAHRAAVPDRAIRRLPTSGAPVAECACGWGTDDSHTTRTDVQAALDHHLATEHGLVSC